MARNPISLDPVSKHVAERDKLLTPEAPRVGNFYIVRKEEFEKAALQAPTRVVGQILLSALMFGAVIDWRLLEQLCLYLKSGQPPPVNGWFDHEVVIAEDGPAVVRRWFVDRHTARLWKLASGLLLSLQRTPGPSDARSAIAAYLLWDVKYVDQLHAQACFWWRQRMPPVLATHVEGRGPARAVPWENWQRLLTAGKGPGGPGPTTFEPQNSQGHQSTSYGSPLLEADLRTVAATLKAARSKTIAISQRSARARNMLQHLHLQTAEAQHLRGWFCECLSKGYDYGRNVRTKRRRPISPATLAGDLSRLRKAVLPGLMLAGRQASALQALYEGELPEDLRQDQIDRRFATIRRFHRWLVANRGYPSLTFRLFSTGPQTAVRARLISEEEHERALAATDQTAFQAHRAALRVALILGFRAGLRPQELLALQPGDFRIGLDGFILLVKPNHFNQLKTVNARRLLPLHLLLSTAEQAEVQALVRFRSRVRGKAAIGTMLLHEGVEPEAVATRARSLEKQLVDLLAVATGDPQVRVYDLRHSFASYLFATLLLPDGDDPRLAPTVGPLCISKERRDVLLPHLLGKGAKGRSALYAVSFLMGHASPGWTLTYYTHLLDWSAAQYVARSSFDHLVPKVLKPAPGGSTVRPAGEAPVAMASDHQPEQAPSWPDWPVAVQALTDLVDGANPALISVRTGIAEDLLSAWLARLRTIVGYKTQKGMQRHRFVASTRGPPPPNEDGWAAKRPRFLLPREDGGMEVLDRVWAACRPDATCALRNPLIISALQRFLEKADPARCDVPFATVEEALQYVSALTALGLEPDCFRVRLQKAGTAWRTPLLNLPSPYDQRSAWLSWMSQIQVDGRPLGPVSRIRISIVNDTASLTHADPSHRIAIMLAAIVGDFHLPD